MTEAALIRYTCEICGELYFPSSQREDCPHEYNTTFTKAMRNELRKLLGLEEKS